MVGTASPAGLLASTKPPPNEHSLNFRGLPFNPFSLVECRYMLPSPSGPKGSTKRSRRDRSHLRPTRGGLGLKFFLPMGVWKAAFSVQPGIHSCTRSSLRLARVKIRHAAAQGLDAPAAALDYPGRGVCHCVAIVCGPIPVLTPLPHVTKNVLK